MKHKGLIAYLIIVFALSLGFVGAMIILGQKGFYLASFYMLAPAIAAIITRLFFYENKFRDANVKIGMPKDYLIFWAIALGITLLSFAVFTLLGAITWDFSGKTFLDSLAAQFATTGQDINDLPQGLTPQMMLWIFFIGGLTIFNIFPGIISGFGEEFGWRGFMFPALYKIGPKAAFIGGGFIWFAWHVPLMLVFPQTAEFTFWQNLINIFATAVGSFATFFFLAYIYIKTENILVASVAHITLNNSARAFSYFVIVQSQFAANIGQILVMVAVAAVLFYSKEFRVFEDYFKKTQS